MDEHVKIEVGNYVKALGMTLNKENPLDASQGSNLFNQDNKLINTQYFSNFQPKASNNIKNPFKLFDENYIPSQRSLSHDRSTLLRDSIPPTYDDQRDLKIDGLSMVNHPRVVEVQSPIGSSKMSEDMNSGRRRVDEEGFARNLGSIPKIRKTNSIHRHVNTDPED